VGNEIACALAHRDKIAGCRVPLSIHRVPVIGARGLTAWVFRPLDPLFSLLHYFGVILVPALDSLGIRYV
jgi:hypothetical protein